MEAVATCNMHDAKSNLSRLVDRAARVATWSSPMPASLVCERQ